MLRFHFVQFSARIVLAVMTVALFGQPATADSVSRLTASDRDFHITALELAGSDAEHVTTVFDEYLASIAEAERAASDYYAWAGRWTKEHIYSRQLQDWGIRISPPSWSMQSALDRAYRTMRTRYFARLRERLPEKVDRIDLLERIALRSEWLSSIFYHGRYPDLVKVIAMCAPSALDREEVQGALSQYELQIAPILERRKRFNDRLRPDFEKAMEDRDVDAVARVFTSIRLNDCEIRQSTHGMINVFAAALSDTDSRAFREAVDTALYPEPGLKSLLTGFIERVLNDPDLNPEIKARARAMRDEIDTDRERLRGDFRAAFDAIFDPDNIRRVARMQAEFSLGIRSDMPPDFDASYREIVNALSKKADRLALELQELIQGQ